MYVISCIKIHDTRHMKISCIKSETLIRTKILLDSSQLSSNTHQIGSLVKQSSPAADSDPKQIPKDALVC